MTRLSAVPSASLHAYYVYFCSHTSTPPLETESGLSDLRVPPPAVKHASNGSPECHISSCHRQVAEPSIAQHSMKSPLYDPHEVSLSAAPVDPRDCALQNFVPKVHCTYILFTASPTMQSPHSPGGCKGRRGRYNAELWAVMQENTTPWPVNKDEYVIRQMGVGKTRSSISQLNMQCLSHPSHKQG